MNKKHSAINRKEIDKIAEYKERLRQLAADKSQLQLYANLINKLSLAKGMDNASHTLVTLLMETLGGTNITLFYDVDGTWFSIDAFKATCELDTLPDSDVRKALVEQKNIFIEDKTDSYFLEAEKSQAFGSTATWIIPLIVEDAVIGIIKMEGMVTALARPEMMTHLKPFINYSALFLKGLIDNSSQLKIAYDNLKNSNNELTKEIETRKKVEADLRKSETLLKTAGQTARFGGWSADLVGRHFSLSREVAAILEMTPDYSPSMDDAIQFFTPEWRQSIAQAFEACARDGRPYDEEVEIITGSGQRLWVRTTGEAMQDRSGAITRVHGSFQDISGLKQAEEEREKLRAQLAQAQKMEAIGRLAGDVAHDFNNMLSIILGNAEMIIDDLDPENRMATSVHEIRKAAERSANLTRQLLAFARKQTIAPQMIDFNKTVDGMLKMLRRLIGEDIDLVWLPKKNLWPIKIDPSQVDQILANLCINARDAINDVGKVTIETANVNFDTEYCREHEGFQPGDFVMIALSDNGCGMGKKVLDNLFEPFFTTKGVGEGTGLGLATVYGIVKQNNGFINVYSEPNKGTTFRIYFPRHTEEISRIHEKPPKDDYPKGSETILLVEDEDAILEMTSMMLERLGYMVLKASNPIQAIEIVTPKASSIDLLMTDVVMPEMNGKDLAKKMAKRFSNLKCLFMSGYTANVIAHHGVLDPGVQFIQKPFSRKDLAQKIRKVLDEA